MRRWCAESSRSYPGRSVSRAVRAARGVELRPCPKGQESPSNPKGAVVAKGAGLRPSAKALEIPPDPTPTVTDRVIQHAIAQVLGPIFDPGFSESSFGFRPGRSAHGALRRVQAHIGDGCRIAVDLDLAKFFDQAS
jgi:hypothetical protein